MAHHTRSNSLPSNGLPAGEDFEDHWIKLNSSEDVASLSATLVLLDGSPRLLGYCGIAKDIMAVVKDSVQGLDSSFKEAGRRYSCFHDIRRKVSSKPRSWVLVQNHALSRRARVQMYQEKEVQDFNVFNIHKTVGSMDAVAPPDLLKKLKASEMAI
ncbi:UNVERIFIED_CONTAM: hypothetical protein Sindi_1398600 [Sesamum indicum]